MSNHGFEGPRWRSDPATPAQIRTLRLKFRYYPENDDWTSLTKGEASDLLSGFFKGLPPREEEPASEAQIVYIRKLVRWTGEDESDWLDGLTKANANQRIPELKAILEEVRLKLSVKGGLEEGMYLKDGTVIRIKSAGDYYLRAFRLVKLNTPVPSSNGERHYRFESDNRLVRGLLPEHRMTKEQAVAFGQETGTCARCGLLLDPNILTKDGQRRWVGPVCELEWA